MHAFHSHPIIDHQFPRGLAPFRSAHGLPIPDLLGALLLKRFEFSNPPVGTVFDGGFHTRKLADGTRFDKHAICSGLKPFPWSDTAMADAIRRHKSRMTRL